jgi:hypothetical protein
MKDKKNETLVWEALLKPGKTRTSPESSEVDESKPVREMTSEVMYLISIYDEKNSPEKLCGSFKLCNILYGQNQVK